LSSFSCQFVSLWNLEALSSHKDLKQKKKYFKNFWPWKFFSASYFLTALKYSEMADSPKSWPIPRNWQEVTSKSPLLAV
jgi:hypothetical protein